MIPCAFPKWTFLQIINNFISQKFSLSFFSLFPLRNCKLIQYAIIPLWKGHFNRFDFLIYFCFLYNLMSCFINLLVSLPRLHLASLADGGRILRYKGTEFNYRYITKIAIKDTMWLLDNKNYTSSIYYLM